MLPPDGSALPSQHVATDAAAAPVTGTGTNPGPANPLPPDTAAEGSADAWYDITAEVIVDPQPLSGQQNMALDAALLETGLREKRCIVRIYRWAAPTVTLGYFQRTLEDTAATAGPALADLPRVRRLTGGGAILHDQELTYSCVIPDTHPLRHAPYQLYGRIHTAIIQLLSEQCVVSRLRAALPALAGTDSLPEYTTTGPQAELPVLSAEPAAAPEPFLCFLRSDPNDVVCDVPSAVACGADARPCATPAALERLPPRTVKIIGSAQRRRRGTILQHGSILLAASRWTPAVPGIQDLYPHFSADSFAAQLPLRLAACLAAAAVARDYLPQERLDAERFAAEASL